MSTTDTRAAFEKRFGPNDSFAWRDENDNYKVASLQSAWEIWQAAIEATKATSVAPTDIRVKYADYFAGIERAQEALQKIAALKLSGPAEAARHDKDSNHADDLRGMLDELQTKFDKQQSAFWACSEKLAQVQRNQETELSDIRILELAEEDFGEQDDRNVKNEALLSFARKVQAARQPAPVADQLKLICAGFGWRKDGDSNVLADRIEHHIRDLKAGIKARDTVIAERDAALAATAAPVLSDEQIGEIADNFKFKDHWQSNAEAIRFARAILAATNRSQP